MIVPEWHVDFLKRPLSLWLGVTTRDNIPLPIKCTGIQFDLASDTFTCFAPSRFIGPVINQLTSSSTLALVGVDVHTYEGYQYKGPFISQRMCTEEEVDVQIRCMKEFADVLGSFGYSAKGFYDAYFHVPSMAITLQALQVFDQSPKVGTGGEIFVKP